MGDNLTPQIGLQIGKPCREIIIKLYIPFQWELLFHTVNIFPAWHNVNRNDRTNSLLDPFPEKLSQRALSRGIRVYRIGPARRPATAPMLLNGSASADSKGLKKMDRSPIKT
jgi:hypothetical protein